MDDISDRYQKQIILEDIGAEGQRKIEQSKVCIVGCGGLGAIAAMYLAGAGIGQISLIDFDTPDISNLHRQVVYDINKPGTKADQLAERIQILNPKVMTEVINEQLTKQNITEFVRQDQIILDCTDDLNAKYLLSDYTAIHQIPLVYASIHKFIGYVSFFNATSVNGTLSANLRHFFPEKSKLDIPSCSDVGAYNVLAGIFGLFQANETLKYILGMEVLENTLMIMNAKDYRQQKIRVNPKRTIPLKEIWEAESYAQYVCADELQMHLKDWKSLEKEGIVISVLEMDEADPLSIANHHYPSSSFEQWRNDLASDASYLIYCRSGRRSDLICSMLNEQFPEGRFYSLTGGYLAHTD